MRRAFAFFLICMALVPATAFAAPNDVFWDQQWNLRAIRADKAWSKSKGSGVVVAVVDTGVDLGHPDLQGKLVAGFDFVNPGAPPQDHHGHGTHMAGIIAAATGNTTGVSSVAPLAKIMPVRVLDANGKGSTSNVASGIRWAVDHGADVINLSLAETSDGISLPTDFLKSPAINDAIHYAAGAGRFVAIASGNNFDSGGKSATSYDADVGGVLVVGASTSTDKRAAYSNYGAGLDVLAPGGGSATNPTGGGCTQSVAIVSTWWDEGANESAYGTGCGTSMAVAHVAGVAALLMSKGYSNVSAANRIIGTAVDLGPPGRDNPTGYGRVDAAAAVGAISSVVPAPKPKLKPKPKPSVQPTKVAAAGSPSPNALPSNASPSVEPSPTPTFDIVAAAPGSKDSPLAPRKPLVLFAGGLVLVMSLAHGAAAFSRRSG